MQRNWLPPTIDTQAKRRNMPTLLYYVESFKAKQVERQVES